MPETLTYAQIRRMLLGAAETIRDNHEMLSQLDAAVGDGDHGASMLRCMDALVKTVPEGASVDLGTLFSNIAWAIMSCDAGSTSPLLGSFFLGLGEAAGGRAEIDLPAWTALFEAGLARMQKQTRAQIGDKTMMDAFLPALAALKACPSETGIRSALERAADAAAVGAEATKAMRAKYGRARHLGDRVIGHADPGAVSASLILKGFSEGLD